MIRQCRLYLMNQLAHQPLFEQAFKPGDFVIFTVPIKRSENWKSVLEKYGLLNKIIYQSEPSWNGAHMERKAPSCFVVIVAI